MLGCFNFYLFFFFKYTQLSFKLMLHNTAKSPLQEITLDDSVGKKMTAFGNGNAMETIVYYYKKVFVDVFEKHFRVFC